MIWQRVSFALLAAMLVAAAALPVRAEDDKKPAAGDDKKPAQEFCTVRVKRWVDEPYECTKTTYKVECKEEKYTAYKCETVPVEKSRTVTVCKTVPETKVEKRKVVECVPTWEEKTTMQKSWTCQKVTVMEKKCVDKGHYECKEVPCGPSFADRLHNAFRHSCGGCGDCCETKCEPACPRTKTVKCWVPCPTYVECPRTKTERVCVEKPVTCKVCVMKKVEKEVECKVTTCKVVKEEKVEKYTVCEVKKTPYEATRTVKKCVPVTETVKGTHKVCKWVEEKVPVSPCANTCCESSCRRAHSCRTSCCKQRCHHTSSCCH
jgi:hypothetical protein